jgi:hypothetical protein
MGHSSLATAFLIDIWRLEIAATCWKHSTATHSNRHSCGVSPEWALRIEMRGEPRTAARVSLFETSIFCIEILHFPYASKESLNSGVM